MVSITLQVVFAFLAFASAHGKECTDKEKMEVLDAFPSEHQASKCIFKQGVASEQFCEKDECVKLITDSIGDVPDCEISGENYYQMAMKELAKCQKVNDGSSGSEADSILAGSTTSGMSKDLGADKDSNNSDSAPVGFNIFASVVMITTSSVVALLSGM